jgi:hypothetical protein
MKPFALYTNDGRQIHFTPAKRAAFVIGCCLFAAALYWGLYRPPDTLPWGLGRMTSTSPDAPAASKKPESGREPGYASHFADVARSISVNGVKVDPLDPEHPLRMRVYLPHDIAMETTERQAKELALSIRNALHPEATVYIKSPAGQTLGKTGWLD